MSDPVRVQSVVFVDSRVPDLQTLLDGLTPGEIAFVLDPSRDSIEQISQILAANRLTGLSAISIVGHGSAGAIDLGATVVDDAALQQHSALLAKIGASLVPNGDLQLYACDVASGAAGQQFIADLSHFTGADVAAATHLVGSADFGGSFTLDAATGSIEAPAPFTADALAHFDGELASVTPFDNDQPTLALSLGIVTGGVFPHRGTGPQADFGAVPMGSILTFAGDFGNVGINGTALGQGQIVPISANTVALFSVIGTTFGGNGINTFALPDLQGRTMIGSGQGIGLDQQFSGQQSGSDAITLAQNQMPAGFGGSGQRFDNREPSLGFEYLINTAGPTDGSEGDDLLGAIIAFGSNFTPDGYHLADGSLLDTTTYSDLFNLIGYTYGGSGNSFALPDLRGRAIVGASSDHPLGDSFGQENTSLSSANLPTSAGGQGTPISNDGPSLALNYIIATTGIFPTQDDGDPGTGATEAGQQYLGEMLAYAGPTAPAGWALANGALLPIDGNDALFTLLGPIYGGNGITTFALPDVRGRSVVGIGTSPTLGSVPLSDTNGNADITLVASNIYDAVPTLTVASTASGTEKIAAVISSAATVSDANLDHLNAGNGDYTGASVTIARHNGANADDQFGFSSSGASFTVSGGNLVAGGTFATFTSTGGTLTISFTGPTIPTTILVNDVLQHITYADQNDTPTSPVTLDWAFSDGNAGTQGATPTPGQSFSSTNETVNDVPVVTASAGKTIWHLAPVVIDGALTVSDGNDTTLASAQVAITGNFHAGEDVLFFANSSASTFGNIQVDSITNGVMSLSSPGATATLAQWRAALDAVTYNNTSDTPTLGSRTISFTVNDGTDDSAAGSKTVVFADQAPAIGIGTVDLVTANTADNTVSVLFGDGAGGFSTVSTPGTGTFPEAVALSDVNGDGLLDIVAANASSNTISVRLGNGHGGFVSVPAPAVGNGPVSVALGDLNADGHPDIVAANLSDSDVSVLLGDGSGGFTAAPTPTVAVGTFPRSVALGDVNGDGKLDILTANSLGSTVSVLLGNGSGGFTAKPAVATGLDPVSLALGDVNRDGNLDIVAANGADSTVSVLLGDGSGGFAPAGGSPVSVGTSPLSVALGDVNGDGVLDLVTANSDDNSVSVLLGDGDGGFAAASGSPLAVGNVPWAVALSDVNGDGNLDILAADHSDAAVSVLLGNGSGGFTPASPAVVGHTPQAVALGDIDTAQTVKGNKPLVFNAANGNALVVSDADGDNQTITLAASHGTLTLSIKQGLSFASGDGTADATMTFTGSLADVNAALDGLTYAADSGFVGSDRLDITTSDGIRQTSNSAPITVADQAPTIAIGTADIVTANFTSDDVHVLLGDGSGGFSAAPGPRLIVGQSPTSAALGDVDGDGKLDIVATNFSDSTISVLLGDGHGGFTAPSTPSFAVASQPNAVALADVNDDGNLDAVTADQTSATVSVLLGDGHGVFTPAATRDLLVGNNPVSVVLGDVNGDGETDIVTANSGSDTVGLLLGNGDGSFGSLQTTTVGHIPQAVALGDVDGDGHLDVIAANWQDNTVSVLLGDGHGGFAVVGPVAVGTHPNAVAVGDLDGDGNLDIVTANSGSNTVSILVGDGRGNFTGTPAVAVGSDPLSVALADVDGDGDLDILTANHDDNTTTVLLNDGSAGFTAAAGSTVATGGLSPFSVAVGDIDTAQTTDEDTALVFNAAHGNAIVLSDADGDSQTVTLGAGHGTLKLATIANLSFTTGDGTDDATMTFSGTVADVNAALAGLTYTPDQDFNGDDTLSITADDGLRQTRSSSAITVNAVDDPIVAKDDAFSTTEAAAIGTGLNVFNDNGSGADSDPDGPLTVTAVNGSAGSVDNPITLASGALLTLHGNGTFSYDPNHKFDSLPAAGSGASNLTAHDTFTYTVTGGDTATVTVTVTGVDSDDTLMGQSGVDDHFAGGIGNDWYFVQDAGDTVTEVSGNADRVFASTSWTLTAGAAIENLSTDSHTGTGAIDLTGNELANLIYGNAGPNKLDGGVGNDNLIGWGGNDTYVVDSASDVVQETDGTGPFAGGSDTVETSVSYALHTGSSIETFTTTDTSATTAINLTGNDVAQHITGNAGDNIIDGKGGVDVMEGLAGNDWYIVDNVGDQVIETGGTGNRVFASASWTMTAGAVIDKLSTTSHAGSATIDLTGNALANAIYGNAGDNVLNGKDGNDNLTGLAGADTFVFDTAPNNDTNFDVISDMTTGVDHISLALSVFDALSGSPGGTLAASEFVASPVPVATASDDHILYNTITGLLDYDSNGNGLGGVTHIASLTGHPTLTNTDFLLEL